MELIGTKIGNVRVEKLIGAGGLGEVYLGFDEVLERPVAVKVMRGEHQLNPLSRSRFLREARLLSKLDDPRICRIYDMVQGEDSDYLILEYIEGVSLFQLMQGSIPYQTRLKIAEQIAEALAVAHSEHIIHRDLKPENVMVGANNEVKVLDFGLGRNVNEARHLTPAPQGELPPIPEGEETHTLSHGAIVGTLRFMSPEQARGESVTEASDIYSFGLLLQELMTGKSPYPEDIEQVALYMQVSDGRTLPAKGLESSLTSLIEQLKSLKPGDRPTATQAAAGLRSIMESPGRMKRRRNWVLAALSVLSLMLLTALLTVKLLRPEQLLKPGEHGRIAILPFANQTGEATLDWINIGLMDMVAQTLDEGPQMDVVPTDAVLRAGQNFKLSDSTELSRSRVQDICNALGSQFVVTAAVFREKENFRLHYTLYDIKGFKAVGDLVGSSVISLGSDLSAYLSRRLVADAQVMNIKDEYSTSDVANQNYAIGVQRLNTVGPKVAESYFLVCLDLDPHFLWAKMQLAFCKEGLTEWDEGEHIASQVLQDAQKRHDRKLEAVSLRFIGVIANHRKDYVRAEDYYNRSLTIVHALNDRRGEAKIYNNLAVIAYARSDSASAIQLYQKSLDLKKEIGDLLGEAYTLDNLAIVYHEQHDLSKAEQFYKQSLEISKQIGALDAQELSLGNLGTLYEDRGEYKLAEECASQALKISRDMGDKEGEADWAHNLAESLIQQGRLDDAAKAMEVARVYYKDTPLMIRLDARYQYERGNFSEAFRLMKTAKEATEPGEWTDEFEHLFQAYEKAAKEGHKVPL